ncbi:MAG: ribokinase [Caldilineaceae bacterium SB0670_bin_27]|uniref:Ribokinase n=1 Tax=Caldilineaceae bacterium SB0664_bin_27 TaxID=2605260 RepID=A0A6B0YV76_9CHLR|nr:ribokinase [Caldilineaceae bacterium SB0664_bin_27]MYJ76641.1 ribokinase [Caldilineaceae bacterium SB0670_bin_27]
MPRIAVIGSYVVSLTVRVPRKPVMGEALIGDLFDMGPGGKGTNQAIAAARLGAQVDLLACLGDDPFADSAEQLYADEGVSTDHIHRIPGTNTGVGMVTLLPSGENSIVGHLGANMLMQPLHVEAFEPAIARSDVLMAQLEVPVELVARALELGRKHRVPTILNPAPGQTLEPDTLANVDLLTPNESETRILLGLPPDDPTPTQDLAGRLLELGVETIVVTRGEEGALIVTPRGTEAIPATPVQALDVTGAGDSFNAALAVGLAEGLDLRAAVNQANRAGAYTTIHLGVIDGLPTRAELEAFRGNAV